MIGAVSEVLPRFLQVFIPIFVAAAFAGSGWLGRRIGLAGLRAISKIIAMLLAAIAVAMIRRGWSG